MALDHCLVHHGHVHRFVVTADARGWDVLEEEDSTVLMHVHREDWHRVERDVRLFQMRLAGLENEGWIDSRRVEGMIAASYNSRGRL